MANGERQITPEQREQYREVALRNLGSSLWNYALPKLVTSQEYGGLAELSQRVYGQTISQTPEQSVYEQVFLPQLMQEGGAITSPYVQNTSFQILQQSLFSIKVEDLAGYFNLENISEEYRGKFISELDQQQAGQLVGMFMRYQTDERVKALLGLRQESISNGLEEMLSPVSEEVQDSN